MRTSEIKLYVLHLPNNTPAFNLEEVLVNGRRKSLRHRVDSPVTEEIHVLHVTTDAGIDGVCTVGDARYTTLCPQELEALRVRRVLEELGFGWFEEPLPDRQQGQLQQLCSALDIPILSPETLMHDRDLSARWLISGATDLLRANARHGTTQTLKLANLAEMHGATIELN